METLYPPSPTHAPVAPMGEPVPKKKKKAPATAAVTGTAPALPQALAPAPVPAPPPAPAPAFQEVPRKKKIVNTNPIPPISTFLPRKATADATATFSDGSALFALGARPKLQTQVGGAVPVLTEKVKPKKVRAAIVAEADDGEQPRAAPAPAKKKGKKIKAAPATDEDLLAEVVNVDDLEDGSGVKLTQAQREAEARRKLEQAFLHMKRENDVLKARLKFADTATSKLELKSRDLDRQRQLAIEAKADALVARSIKEVDRLQVLVDKQVLQLEEKSKETAEMMTRWQQREEEITHLKMGLAVPGQEADMSEIEMELGELRADNARLYEELELAQRMKQILDDQSMDLKAQNVELKARLMGNWVSTTEETEQYQTLAQSQYEVEDYHAPVIQVVNDHRRPVQTQNYDVLPPYPPSPHEYEDEEDEQEQEEQGEDEEDDHEEEEEDEEDEQGEGEEEEDEEEEDHDDDDEEHEGVEAGDGDDDDEEGGMPPPPPTPVNFRRTVRVVTSAPDPSESEEEDNEGEEDVGEEEVETTAALRPRKVTLQPVSVRVTGDEEADVRAKIRGMTLTALKREKAPTLQRMASALGIQYKSVQSTAVALFHLVHDE